MTHLELSKLIDTMKVADSKAFEYMGKNVRSPSLVPGTLYIMKEWSIAHHINSDNPFQVVEFVGSGHEENGMRTMFAENPAIKTMKNGDYFFFKAIDKSDNTAFEFGAFMSENCVCITSSSVRVTCYAINGHESVGFNTEPNAAKTPRTPRTQAASTVQSTRKSNVADIDREDIVIEDQDDGQGCEGATLCHPISLMPLRRQIWA